MCQIDVAAVQQRQSCYSLTVKLENTVTLVEPAAVDNPVHQLLGHRPEGAFT